MVPREMKLLSPHFEPHYQEKKVQGFMKEIANPGNSKGLNQSIMVVFAN